MKTVLQKEGFITFFPVQELIMLTLSRFHVGSSIEWGWFTIPLETLSSYACNLIKFVSQRRYHHKDMINL